MCSDSAINTNNAPANLEINWEPNTINLHWYSNNTLIQNVPDVSSSCEYDSTLTSPATIPTRTGYTFTGWRVRPTYNFATLTASGEGSERWARGYHNGQAYCYYNTDLVSKTIACTKYESLKELSNNEWKVHFSWGDVYGAAYCSAKKGKTTNYTYPASGISEWRATYDELSSASGEKRNCWCQATGYKPNGSNVLYGPTSTSMGIWGYHYDFNVYSDCNKQCAAYCSYNVIKRSTFRRVIFGITQ